MAQEKDKSQDQVQEAPQLTAMQQLVELSERRTQMAAARTYMNAERTLSVWVRTALSAMIFGIAIDRLGLMTRGLAAHPPTLFGHPSTPTTLIGTALVLFSILMSLSAGLRFMAFSRAYKKTFTLPAHHKTGLPLTYALMVVLFGIALTLLMWWIG